ncbi:putative protein FAM208A-like [Triplophysa rosa]|uniref:Uncharacterized protein n=1 Tax=Triplophysa rosa TaxID=992332 RepID=A0A9W7T5A6_TRIRA|nr:putative protein FAM208A-like [Triplophysa rosa]
MEHRGVKLSDKGTTSALQWSQNGGGEEEFGCADGPDEERQAAKPAEDPTRTFHIPRKSREKRALFQYVSTDSREFADILQILTSSYKDSLSIGTFVYSKPRLIHNELLEKDVSLCLPGILEVKSVWVMTNSLNLIQPPARQTVQNSMQTVARNPKLQRRKKNPQENPGPTRRFQFRADKSCSVCTSSTVLAQLG